MLDIPRQAARYHVRPMFGLSLEQARGAIYAALVLLEGLILASMFLLVDWAYQGEALLDGARRLALMIPPLYLLMAFYRGVYSIPAITDLRQAFARMTGALAMTMGVFLFVLFSFKVTEDFSRFTAMAGVLGGFLAILQLRRAAIRIVHATLGRRAMDILVIDDGGPRVDGLDAQHVDTRRLGLVPDLNDPHMLDLIGSHFYHADRVLVSCPRERRVQWARVLRAAGVRGEIVTAELQDISAIALERHEEFTSLVVAMGPLGLRQRLVKRMLDLLLAGIALIALAPVLALVALAIRLDDGGPILFVQKRVGYGNRFFPIYKFRTMRADPSGTDGARSASRDDDRITPLGAFLRRTSIDELPQLYNVLVGQMSLVGPRPHAIRSTAGAKLFWEIDQSYWDRHALKPGLTGLAQVRGYRGSTRTEIELSERLKSDLEYAADWTVGRDLLILLRTLRVIVHRNAF